MEMMNCIQTYGNDENAANAEYENHAENNRPNC